MNFILKKFQISVSIDLDTVYISNSEFKSSYNLKLITSLTKYFFTIVQSDFFFINVTIENFIQTYPSEIFRLDPIISELPDIYQLNYELSESRSNPTDTEFNRSST